MSVMEPFDFDAAGGEFDKAVIEGIERDFRVRDAQMRRSERRKGPGLIRRARMAENEAIGYESGENLVIAHCLWCGGGVTYQSDYIPWMSDKTEEAGLFHINCYDHFCKHGKIEGLS